MKQSFFWRREALHEQEAIGGDAQGRMVVKAAPTSALEVTEAELLFEFLVVALDAPAQLGDADQLLERGCCRKVLKKYLVGSASPVGHSMSSHCSGCCSARQ